MLKLTTFVGTQVVKLGINLWHPFAFSCPALGCKAKNGGDSPWICVLPIFDVDSQFLAPTQGFTKASLFEVVRYDDLSSHRIPLWRMRPFFFLPLRDACRRRTWQMVRKNPTFQMANLLPPS